VSDEYTEKEMTLDEIENAIREGYDNTLDVQGPNWAYMAEKVWERLMAPTDSMRDLLRTAADRLDDLNQAGDTGTIQVAVALRELATA
jgi:DNA phosphorothioation-dependent restriction protein DptG